MYTFCYVDLYFLQFLIKNLKLLRKEINYENVRNIACQDKRIGISHSLVPGPDLKKGFGGTCFPKDMNNLNYEMKKMNMNSYIIDSALERNNKIDRKDKDWSNDKGRSVI